MITLNGITLSKGLFWHDSFDFVPIKQVNKNSVTGRVLLMRSRIQDGRKINLTGTETSNQLKRSDVQLISDMRGSDEPLTLVYHGNTYLVRFDLQDAKNLDVAPLWNDTTAHLPDSMWYVRSIKLIEVLE